MGDIRHDSDKFYKDFLYTSTTITTNYTWIWQKIILKSSSLQLSSSSTRSWANIWKLLRTTRVYTIHCITAPTSRTAEAYLQQHRQRKNLANNVYYAAMMAKYPSVYQIILNLDSYDRSLIMYASDVAMCGKQYIVLLESWWWWRYKSLNIGKMMIYRDWYQQIAQTDQTTYNGGKIYFCQPGASKH